MNYYKLKFEREQKANPIDWMLINDRGLYRLQFIGKNPLTERLKAV